MPWIGTQWGGWSGHLRVGIDVGYDNYDTWTGSINVYVAVHVQCDSSWNFDDNQTVTLTGNVGSTWNFYNGLQQNQSVHVGTATIYGQAQNYNGGPTYRFHAALSGAYNGAAPAAEVYFTLPARPKRLPAPPNPGPQPSNVTATSVVLTWGGSPDYGGGTPNADRLLVSRDSGFTSIVHDTTQGGASRTVGGLAPGTQYWAAASVRTEVGMSGWSPITSFSLQSLSMPLPTASDIGPDSAKINWSAPSGGTATGYDLQLATNSGFTSGLVTMNGTWATSRVLSGLTPGATYWVRVRATTSSGPGTWSGAIQFQTLSGAKVVVNNSWVDGVAYAGVNGSWVLAKVNKGVDGRWVL